MTLKTCPCCGKMQTTKTAVYIGRQFDKMLLFNCTSCNGTFAIVTLPPMIRDIINRLGNPGPAKQGTPRKVA